MDEKLAAARQPLRGIIGKVLGKVGGVSIAPPKIDWTDSALLIDVDGTLLHIQSHPDDVFADTGLIDLLSQVHAALGGAFALVSGRPITELDRIFAPAKFPAVGAHGAESRIGSGRIQTEAALQLPGSALEQIVRYAAGRSGLLAETKDFGVALHYRQAPALEQECRELMRAVAGDLDKDFRLIEGKMVLELTPHAHNKGEAIKKMLQREPFSQRQPVFVGDDVTDEDGFREVNRQSGVSVRVGACDSTAAQYVIEDVDAVHRWLLGIAGSASGSDRGESD